MGDNACTALIQDYHYYIEWSTLPSSCNIGRLIKTDGITVSLKVFQKTNADDSVTLLPIYRYVGNANLPVACLCCQCHVVSRIFNGVGNDRKPAIVVNIFASQPQMGVYPRKLQRYI